MLWALLSLAAIGAVPSAVPSLHAVHTDVAPKVDGRIDDACWKSAAPSESFTQKFPGEGQAPSERTRVRVVYDDRAIYFALDCEQRSSPVIGRLTRRDRTVESDRVSIDIDTRADGKSAFHFEVNAAGVIVDAIRYDEQVSDAGDLLLDWDENWDAAVGTSSTGWTAELAIPLRALRFEDSPAPSWGFEVRRYLSGKQEIDEWAFIPRSVAGEMLHYGRLEFEHPLQPGGSVELRPFVLGQVRRRDRSEDLVESGAVPQGSVGLDARWHPSQDMTLDFTLNPDFGQIEADQVVLNLSNFELFFPEKRPFFLEGADAFSTPMLLLYTRRVGRAPDAVLLRDGARAIEAPVPSTILGAAKLVGRPADHLTIASLSALTGAEHVGVQLADGTSISQLADPTTFFQALRVKRDLGEHASIGLMATAVKRFEETGPHPLFAGTGSTAAYLCPSTTVPDPLARCFHDAYVGAADVRWRSDSGDYVASAQGALSLIEGGPDRALPDGTVLRSGDLAPAFLGHAAKEGGSWIFDLLYEGYARKFDINDAGYLSRQNHHHSSAVLGYRVTEPFGLWLEQKTQLELYRHWNTDGLRLAEGYQLNSSGKFENFMSYFVELHYRRAYFDDREVGDGTALERPGLFGLELELHTDPRAPVVAGAFTQTQLLLGGGLHFELDGSVAFKVLPQLDLELLPTLFYQTGELRYTGLSAAAGGPLFGVLQAAAVGATLRATYTFTPRVSLQAYAQLYLDLEHFDRFRYSAGMSRAIALDDPALLATSMPEVGADIQEGTLNANLVLRWEYLPGSTLFFVYTRAQSGAVALERLERPALELRSIARGPAIDVLAVKLSYWWGS